ncbi:MAG: phosphotransferase [Betaproteobacteria bacterium]|nr:phosphotransferase [Betaproteobacteria bacterium]
MAEVYCEILRALPSLDRLTELEAWLARSLPDRDLAIEPASADASFRRYFRVRSGQDSWIVMDAPPQHENCAAFVEVGRLLLAAGLNAPRVLAEDLTRGFLLLTDLGTTTFLQAMIQDRSVAPALFADAIAALVTWQSASREGVLAPYDEKLLRRELDLFPEWYLGRHLGLTLGPDERAVLDEIGGTLLANVLAQPRVFVHRDYMPRNLMVTDPNPGILDFQDAVYGPITYDVASLFRDAFLSWEEAESLDWAIRYWEQARRAGLPVASDFSLFYRDMEWMGMQRHLKVLGIFARLHYRDRKAGYLEDTPRFLGYVRGVAERYNALRGLVPLLDRVERRTPEAGYTF